MCNKSCLRVSVIVYGFSNLESTLENKGYNFFEKDKDTILVDNILGILLEDIFRQLILQRIRIKDSLRIFKHKDKDF